MAQFKYVSLFCGIGGFDTALAWLGGECVFASDIDKRARLAFETLHHVKPHGDITKIPTSEIPDHDLLVGGFPCQPFSVAGKQLGTEDTRGTLFYDMARIAKDKKPKLILMENVKGLLGNNGGNTIIAMCHLLNDLGYYVALDVINSCKFGVAQSRERVYMVAIRKDLEQQGEWHYKGRTILAKTKQKLDNEDVETFDFNFPKGSEFIPRLIDFLDGYEVAPVYYLDEQKYGHIIEMAIENKPIGRKKNEKVPVVTRIAEMYKGAQAGRVFDPMGLSPTLDTASGGNREPKILIGNRIRRLTPKEYFRLQGFTLWQYEALKELGFSDTQLYKKAGNAVTVPVIMAIGNELIEYL